MKDIFYSLRIHVNEYILATLLCMTMAVNTTVAGDIFGIVQEMKSPSVRKTPQSPFARARSVEEIIPHAESTDSTLFAVVYLEEHKLLIPMLDIDISPVVDQINMTIIPHILPIQVGTLVNFVNSDEVYHNIFSLSPPRKFDLGRYGKGGKKTIKFKKPGEVRVFCDIHPHMNSVILVLPNNYFASVYADGRFIIKDVPEGKYKIHAWHETYPESIRTLSVPQTGEVEVVMMLGER